MVSSSPRSSQSISSIHPPLQPPFHPTVTQFPQRPRGPQSHWTADPLWTTLFTRSICAPGTARGTCLPHLAFTVTPAPSLPQAPCPGRFFISGSRLGCPWTRTILSPPAIWVMHLIRGVSSPRGPFIGLFVYVRPPPGSGHLGKPTLPTVRQVLVMETWN